MKTNNNNRKFRSTVFISNFRHGFNLVEVSIALALAGIAMTYTYMVISNGIKQQRMAAVVSNAVHLAKIKMAQIDSVSVLQSDKTTGEIPGYPGYSFETVIGEEDMDLLKLAGKEGKKPEDLLGGRDSEMNKLIMRRSGQANQGSSTAGIIRVFRIKVTIKYPTGSGTEAYTAETFKSAQY
ncbi:prepilin-type N-terminal cleavage/methylation domain-containing protein [Leptospira gomenensis]|uniref:Prepilin-type N-terminal cleavage/methylation domain-containing protein n=1 Tax=Leptospira gomenensis TaxID=2484974 RepID=A0A5F1YN33_9LEPT|nr:prepilin-type N-terminal cleavage/methylation domain-containing protein [Leptospira gomenensis]TGK35017.1 prepilin-type N-terminal cleavage/methylation domain-containing protein [Leptospira gomenensis]TGK35305.1 prepilin-type N-terminal cleavage/methylation domain-containing protein [Leptospira gomenensis]TGK51790.1 prepilin-type N-terminal cleavage/methylation domain-containing protein [Leptospira gomenensis]TGK58385.1 prepilin-type N-terminal cleavage/methylation domain-containing protein 